MQLYVRVSIVFNEPESKTLWANQAALVRQLGRSNGSEMNLYLRGTRLELSPE